MTNIVERLRALAPENAVGEPSLAHAAADEIERLRVANNSLSRMVLCSGREVGDLRAALGLDPSHVLVPRDLAAEGLAALAVQDPGHE